MMSWLTFLKSKWIQGDWICYQVHPTTCVAIRRISSFCWVSDRPSNQWTLLWGCVSRISWDLHMSISEEMNHGIITLKIPTEVMLPGLNALNAPSPAWQLPHNVMGRCGIGHDWKILRIWGCQTIRTYFYGESKGPYPMPPFPPKK